jgi:hypothetical protein
MVIFQKIDYATKACSSNIEMTPLCKVDATVAGVWGASGVRGAGGVDEQERNSTGSRCCWLAGRLGSEAVVAGVDRCMVVCPVDPGDAGGDSDDRCGLGRIPALAARRPAKMGGTLS